MWNKSGVDLNLRKAFPELIASKAKRQVQTRASSLRKEMQKTKIPYDNIEKVQNMRGSGKLIQGPIKET